MTLWVVHTGGSLIREPYALENGCVATMWEDIGDIRMMSNLDSLRKEMKKKYERAADLSIDSWARQLWRFTHVVKVGDHVVMPRTERREYAVGKVTGPYEYRSYAPEHCRHVYPVKWLKTDLQRTNLPEDMYYSFKAHISFYQVTRNEIERRLLAMIGKDAT